MNNQILALSITSLLALWRIPALRDGALSFVPKLPRSIQWLAPLLLSLAAACGQGYLDGARGEALLLATLTAGGQIGAEAIAAWHVGKRLWLAIKAAPGTATVLVIGLSTMATQGCAGSFEEARLAGAQDRLAGAKVNPARCASLDSKHAWGGAVAVGAASLAGVSGLATIKVDDEDRDLRYGLAVGSVGAAALAVGAEAYARSAATSYARECQ